jgi:hypothetical protein
MSDRKGYLVRFVAAVYVAVGLCAGALVANGPQAALAYNACKDGSSASISPSTGAGGSTVDLTATFKDCNGNPVAGVQATFTQVSGPANCQATFANSSGVTNAQGQVTVTVTLPVNCPGQFTLGATVQGVQVQAVAVESGGFPNTAAGSGSAVVSKAWLLMVVAGAFIVIVSVGALLFSFRRAA